MHLIWHCHIFMHTYICAAQTIGDGVFIRCVGSETHGLWAAAVVRSSEREKSDYLIIRSDQSDQQSVTMLDEYNDNIQ